MRSAILAALVAAMLVSSASAQSGANYDVTRGVNRPGNDYAKTAPVSPAECQARCDRDPKCKVWVYAAPPDYRAGCYLKAVVPQGQTTDACCTVGIKRDASSSSAPPPRPAPVAPAPAPPAVASPPPASSPPSATSPATTHTLRGLRVQEFPGSCSDCGNRRVDLGTQDFCALTLVVAGGFNSGCAVTGQPGARWYLDVTDPGPPDAFQGESQECRATCFTIAR